MAGLRLSHKTGTPFSFVGRYSDPQTGLPQNLTGLTIASRIRTKDGTLRSTCLVTIADQSIEANLGLFRLEVIDTSNWIAFEVLHWDVACGTTGNMIPTIQTVEIAVTRRIT